MACYLINSAVLLSDACDSFRRYMVEGLRADEVRIAKHVENSLMLVTALTPKIGYDKAAAIAKKANKDGTTLKAASLALGYLSESEFDEAINPKEMTRPH